MQLVSFSEKPGSPFLLRKISNKLVSATAEAARSINAYIIKLW
jgi:hypothetical protein